MLSVVALLTGCAAGQRTTTHSAVESATESPEAVATISTPAESNNEAPPSEALTDVPSHAEVSADQNDGAHHAHFFQSGVASFYGKKFQGRRTASGERYDAHKLTAAHRTLPLGSYARVTAPGNGRTVVVRINDRGPFTRGRAIDLSYAAAAALGLQRAGTLQVNIESVGGDAASR